MTTEQKAREIFDAELATITDRCARLGSDYVLPARRNVPAYDTVTALRSDVTSSGNSFFDRSTMKWWGSRVVGLYGRRVLVTSETRMGPEERPVRYSVRYVYRQPNTDHLELETFAFALEDKSVAVQVARLLAAHIATTD